MNDGKQDGGRRRYDRRGRLATTVRNGITTTHAWNDADLPLGEAHAGGSLNTLAVERAYFGAADTNALKLERLRVMKAGVHQRWSTNACDTAGRLSGVTADTGGSAPYGYLPNSPLWQTLTFKQGATTRLTTTRAFDRLNRLQTISSAPSAAGAPPVGVGYLYNDANQRVRATEADGSHWVYEYDALGQVKGGRKFWADGTPVAGQQFTCVHDDIGNRTATGRAAARPAPACAPPAMRATGSTSTPAAASPRKVDVLSVAAGGSTVTVNSQPAYRRGEYFWRELTVINTNGPVATLVSVAAGGTPATGRLLTAPTNQVFAYDLEGGTGAYHRRAADRPGLRRAQTLPRPGDGACGHGGTSAEARPVSAAAGGGTAKRVGAARVTPPRPCRAVRAVTSSADRRGFSWPRRRRRRGISAPGRSGR